MIKIRHTLYLAALFFTTGYSAAATKLEAAQPNIILVLSDDQSWNGLSTRMHPDLPWSASDFVRTPNIARLAKQGMRFSAAYAPASVCSPTRISLQTGKSPAQLHWTKAAPTMTAASGYKLIPPTIRKHIGREEITIAEMLKTAGYATAHYGKWHIGGGGPGLHGYDEHDGDTGNKDAAPHKDPNPVDIFGMSRRAIAFMKKNHAAKKPFFIQLSYHALHYSENALETTKKEYQARGGRRNEKEITRGALAENLDTGVGMLMKALDELKAVDNTYFIYMSDNGAGGGKGNGSLRGGKGGVWEGGIRVPLIIRGPNIKPNTFCHSRVVGYDLYPTFCQWSGVEAPLPKGVEGGSIIPLLAKGEGIVKRPREELVFHFPHYQSKDGPHTAILSGDLKLVRFYETDRLNLFNLRQDISESNDLAVKMPDKTKELNAKLSEYLKQVSARLPVVNPQYDPNKPPTSTRKGGKGGKGGKERGKRPNERPATLSNPALPVGKTLQWSANGGPQDIVAIYRGKTLQVIQTVFGKPDATEGNFHIYRGLRIRDAKSGENYKIVKFLITDGVVKAVQVESGGKGGGNKKNAGQGNRPQGNNPRGARMPTPLFRTDVPAHLYNIILGRPTDSAITLSVLAHQAMDGFFTYGMKPDTLTNKTPVLQWKAGEAIELDIKNLKPNTRYYYKFNYQLAGTNPTTSASATFHTQRATGSTFVFTVQADSHLDFGTNPAVYERTLKNALTDRTDFHVALGDTFMTGKYVDHRKAYPHYLAQRYYFGRLCHSASLFFVLGNHDGESLRYWDGTANNPAAWSANLRKELLPNPSPNGFYTGNSQPQQHIGLLEDYYAWEWGDGLFVTLDPFWFTQRTRGKGDNWNWTLGKTQYDWLASTLANSKNKYKFIFLHHLVGGSDRSQRGGKGAAAFFEWGGRNWDGENEFALKRSGWAKPIHELLVQHGVSIVFHGHDHLFAKEELDGITYQCVPQPSHSRGGTRTAAEYGYKDGVILGSSGHIRVTVSPVAAKVDYVKSILPGAESNGRKNGMTAHSYNINSKQ